MYKKVQSKLDQVLGITRENLTGVRVIRAFHQEAKEADRFRENNEALSAMQIFVGKISACMNPVTYIIVNSNLASLSTRSFISTPTPLRTQFSRYGQTSF